MELSPERRLGEIVALRVKAKTNAALQRDLTSAIQDAFKKHGVVVDPDLKTNIIVALADEIDAQLGEVVLPGGTNC